MISKIIICLALVSIAQSLEIIQCGTTIPPPIELTVADCDQLPCPLFRGESGKANITFTVPFDTDDLHLQVKAKTFGITVGFPLPDPQVCHNLAVGECPMKKGDVLTYKLDIPVKKIYPKISLELTLTFLGPNKEKVACFKLPSKVMDRKRTRKVIF